MQKQIIGYCILILAVTALSAQGATVSFSTSAPTPGADDIYSLSGVALDRDNVGGDGETDGTGNDDSTYVAPDRPAQGQTFTANSLMTIEGIWIQHPGYSGNNPGGEEADNTWYAMGADTQINIRITDPSAAGTDDFVLSTETATILGTETDVLPAEATNTANGTGTWIHLVLDTPVPVAGETTYGFDLTASDGTFFEIMGISDAAAGGNPYADGAAYISGTDGAGDTTLTAQTGDRVFIIEMGPYQTAASNPTPIDGAVNVDSDAAVTFGWDTGLGVDTVDPNAAVPNPDILVHYLFLRAGEPNFVDVTPIVIDADSDPVDGVVDPSISYTLGSLLASDTTYYWRVDEGLNNMGSPYGAGDPNNVIGPVWSFDTELKNPQLNPIFPADVAVNTGDVVTFTVDATNPLTGDDSDLEYQWYRNGSMLTGETGSQYQRTIISGEEGDTYYCLVTLPTTARTVQSRTATVLIKKLLAHWPFDGNVEDITGNGNNGTHIGDPNYTTGKENQALIFDGETDYVDLPDGFSDLTTGLTVTLWAKPTAANSFARFFDWGNGDPSDNIFFCRTGTTNTLRFNTYLADETSTPVEAPDTLELDVWQFLAVTMDNAGNVVLYKNGIQVASGTVSVPNVVTRTGNLIGESNWENDALYQGLMDDMKVYNYAKSGEEIAQIYYESEGEFCMEYPAWDLSGPEGEPDCVVNLYDLEGLAEEFLVCGYYPECP